MTPTEIGALASCPALSIAMGLVAARGTRVSFSLRIAMWALPVVAVVTAHVATLEVSGLFRTLAITTVLFISMKALVTLEDRVRGMSPMKTAQWLRFALGWVGMTPKVFATRNKTPAPHQVRQCLHACLFIAVGVAIFVALRYSSALRSTYLVVMPLALLGLVLVMHSGVLAILATLWRAAGMNVAPVMRAPVASKSLSDFWSTRWNIPFTEMLRATVLKPARRLFGRHGAVLACFLVSGVLHDVAISLPVQAGYGLPTLYFLLHGVLVLVERWLEQRGIALSSSWIGRVWCFAWIVGPLPLLMHEPFIKGVVMPVFGH